MQLKTHILERFLATLTGVVSPAPGLREPYRVADMIMMTFFWFVMREEEQEWFAAEVR